MGAATMKLGGQLRAKRKRVTRRQLGERLDSFFGHFSSTLELADELVSSRSHPQEVLILLCSRLDALASEAAREGTPSKKAFIDFVTAFSGERDLFESISAGDLYYELAYHDWILPGTIERPGRVRRYSQVDDPVISLLDESGIPLTESDARQFLRRIMAALRQAFRVMPRQRLAKRHRAKREDVIQAIAKGFASRRKRATADVLPQAIDGLLHAKTVAAVLYEKYRCEAIHGAAVLFNEDKFFTYDEPYWEPEDSPYFGAYLLVEFPARFLASVLRACMETYRRHLLEKRKLPPDVFFHAFADDDPFAFLNLIDDDKLPQGALLRLRLPPR
jgi:hypothetical protein